MGALLFVLGVLVLFAVMMGLFLIVPFFLFLAGIVAMMVSDRKRGRKSAETDEDEEQQRLEAAEDAEIEASRQRTLTQ